MICCHCWNFVDEQNFYFARLFAKTALYFKTTLLRWSHFFACWWKCALSSAFVSCPTTGQDLWKLSLITPLLTATIGGVMIGFNCPPLLEPFTRAQACCSHQHLTWIPSGESCRCLPTSKHRLLPVWAQLVLTSVKPPPGLTPSPPQPPLPPPQRNIF